MWHIVFLVDDARPASSPSTRSRRRPADPCPRLGSAGLALGGAAWRGAPLDEEPGPGPVVDPDHVWWRSRGPVSVRRDPAPPEVVRRRVREEDEHVHRYMVALEGGRFSNTWQFLQGSHFSYDPMRVPSLWVSTAHAAGIASVLDSSVVFDLY